MSGHYLCSTSAHYVSYEGAKLTIYQRRTGIRMTIPYPLITRIVKKVEAMTKARPAEGETSRGLKTAATARRRGV